MSRFVDYLWPNCYKYVGFYRFLLKNAFAFEGNVRFYVGPVVGGR
jgi:hypothetical protein